MSRCGLALGPRLGSRPHLGDIAATSRRHRGDISAASRRASPAGSRSALGDISPSASERSEAPFAVSAPLAGAAGDESPWSSGAHSTSSRSARSGSEMTQPRPATSRSRRDTTRRCSSGSSRDTSLRAEDADIRAGVWCCAASSSEHRVSTTEKRTVNTAEYGRARRNACPLGRWLGDKSPYSASRQRQPRPLGQLEHVQHVAALALERQREHVLHHRHRPLLGHDAERLEPRAREAERALEVLGVRLVRLSHEIGRDRPRSAEIGGARPRLDESRSRALSGRISGSLGASRLQREAREGEGEGERRQQPQRGAAPFDMVGDGREHVAGLCFAVGRLERAQARDQVREDRLPRHGRDTAEI